MKGLLDCIQGVLTRAPMLVRFGFRLLSLPVSASPSTLFLTHVSSSSEWESLPAAYVRCWIDVGQHFWRFSAPRLQAKMYCVSSTSCLATPQEILAAAQHSCKVAATMSISRIGCEKMKI